MTVDTSRYHVEMEARMADEFDRFWSNFLTNHQALPVPKHINDLSKEDALMYIVACAFREGWHEGRLE